MIIFTWYRLFWYDLCVGLFFKNRAVVVQICDLRDLAVTIMMTMATMTLMITMERMMTTTKIMMTTMGRMIAMLIH